MVFLQPGLQPPPGFTNVGLATAVGDPVHCFVTLHCSYIILILDLQKQDENEPKENTVYVFIQERPGEGSQELGSIWE